MSKYTKSDFGSMSEIAKRENGKAFLHDALNLTNEEVYIILSGAGIITVDGEQIPVVAGSAVRVATGAARTIENTGNGEMQFICIQARENSLTQFGFADAAMC